MAGPELLSRLWDRWRHHVRFRWFVTCHTGLGVQQLGDNFLKRELIFRAFDHRDHHLVGCWQSSKEGRDGLIVRDTDTYCHQINTNTAGIALSRTRSLGRAFI